MRDRNGYGNDAYCKLLLRGNAIADASPAGHSIVNSASPVTVVAPTGTGLPSGFTSALRFVKANSQRLQIADSPDWYFGSGAFSIDFFVNFTSLAAGTSPVIAAQRGASSGLAWQIMYDQASSKLSFYNSPDGTTWADPLNYTWAPATGAFHHVYLGRLGSSLLLGIDGAAKANVTFSNSIYDSAQPLYIGHDGSNSSAYLDGQIVNLRISGGAHRWGKPFPVPNRWY